MGNKINPSHGDIFPENNETRKLPPPKDDLDKLVHENLRSEHSTFSGTFSAFTAFFSDLTSQKVHVKVYNEIHSNRTSPTQNSTISNSLDSISAGEISWHELSNEIKELDSKLRYLAYGRELVISPCQTLSEKLEQAIHTTEHQRKKLGIQNPLQELVENADKIETLYPRQNASAFHLSLLQLHAILELIDIEDRVSKVESKIDRICFEPVSPPSPSPSSTSSLKDLCIFIHKETSKLHDLLEEMHAIEEIDHPKTPRLFSEKPNPRAQLHNRLIEAKASLLEKQDTYLESIEETCNLTMKPIRKTWKTLIQKIESLPQADRSKLYRLTSSAKEFKTLSPFEKDVCKSLFTSADKETLSEITTENLTNISKLLSIILL